MDLISNIEKYENRLSWDEYFMNIAFLVSKRSSCKRLSVGCVIISNDNRIIASGYNGHLPGTSHDNSIIKDNHEQVINHAEANAICDIAKRGVISKDSIIYITHFPCINCFKLLVSSGIKKIKYYNNYKNDDIVIKLALESSISIQQLKI